MFSELLETCWNVVFFFCFFCQCFVNWMFDTHYNTLNCKENLYFHPSQPHFCSCQIKYAVDSDWGLFFENLQVVISQLQTKCQEHVEAGEGSLIWMWYQRSRIFLFFYFFAPIQVVPLWSAYIADFILFLIIIIYF